MIFIGNWWYTNKLNWVILLLVHNTLKHVCILVCFKMFYCYETGLCVHSVCFSVAAYSCCFPLPLQDFDTLTLTLRYIVFVVYIYKQCPDQFIISDKSQVSQALPKEIPDLFIKPFSHLQSRVHLSQDFCAASRTCTHCPVTGLPHLPSTLNWIIQSVFTCVILWTL